MAAGILFAAQAADVAAVIVNKGVEHGLHLYRRAGFVQRRDVGVHHRLQQAGGIAMSLMQIIGLVAAVGLLAYLIVALIKPEAF